MQIIRPRSEKNPKSTFNDVVGDVAQTGADFLSEIKQPNFSFIAPRSSFLQEISTAIVTNATGKFTPVPSDELIQKLTGYLKENVDSYIKDQTKRPSDNEIKEILQSNAAVVIDAMEEKAKGYGLGSSVGHSIR